MTATQNIRQTVHQIMPAAIDKLKQLIRIPSIAAPGYPRERVMEAAYLTEDLLKAVGFQVRLLDTGGYPAVYGEIPAPGAPTVLLYAHYDVQPVQEEKWHSPPFEPSVRDGRLYGRGSADNKSGIVAHLATIQAFDAKPPVGVKIIVEGDEEFDSSLPPYITQNSELFKADAAIICDHGNIVVGQPTLTTTLRGYAELTIEVRTLTDLVHNGIFGGPVPDALIALCRIVATFHDRDGHVQIPGLDFQPGDWRTDIPEEVFRHAAGLLPDVDLIGDRDKLSTQLWAGYAINVTGLDTTSVARASNSLMDAVRARITFRVPPDQNAEQALTLLVEHLKSAVPWGAKLTISDCHTSNGFTAKTDGPAYQAARKALKGAYSKDPQIIGDGASIPLVNVLSECFPQQETIIWGAEDLAAAHIHGPNESVDPEELERVILTQALFLEKYGKLKQ